MSNQTSPATQSHMRFVLIRGVLCYGVPVGVFVAGAIAFGGKLHSFVSVLPVSLGVFLVGGLLFGESMWQYSKWRHAQRT